MCRRFLSDFGAQASRLARVAAVTLSLASICSCNPTPPPTEAPDPRSPIPSVKPVGRAELPALHSTDWGNTPVIDSHIHVMPSMFALAQTLEVFDRVGVGRFVTKSAGPVGSPKYNATLAMMRVVGPRMRAFANIDWTHVNHPDFAQQQVRLLEQARRDGIIGIKIFKDLGLSVRDAQGHLLNPSSPVLQPIFEACGRLGLIVAWHIADPVAFFEPVTPNNERYDELRLAPDWSFHGKDYPSHAELMSVQRTVIERNPTTTFLLIHLANNAENLDYVEAILADFKNVYVDTSARIPEIGRHPSARVRQLFLKHQDRILFGSDFIAHADGSMQLGSVSPSPPSTSDAVSFYRRHFDYFETETQQLDHPTPIQGNWKINAIHLPPEVLRKLYVTNAERLMFRD